MEALRPTLNIFLFPPYPTLFLRYGSVGRNFFFFFFFFYKLKTHCRSSTLFTEGSNSESPSTSLHMSSSVSLWLNRPIRLEIRFSKLLLWFLIRTDTQTTWSAILNLWKKKNAWFGYEKSAKGAQWLSGRVLDSRPKGRRFEPHRRHCVVVLEQDTFILA